MPNRDHFKPYEGDEPYIFISYAHADYEAVMEIICDMHDRGFHIWYDEGIEVGSEWTECIASHLAGAALMLGFVTDKYMASDNCRREMNYAVQKKKKVINIFLSPTTLTPGMELQIGGIWALMKYTYPSEEYFYQKLYESPALQSENFGADPTAIVVKSHHEEHEQQLEERHEKKKLTREGKKAVRAEIKAEKKYGRVRIEEPPVVVEAKVRSPMSRTIKGLILCGLAAVVIALAVLSIVGYRLGFFDRLYNSTLARQSEVVTLAAETEAKFTNPLFETAAREYCGKATGSLTVGDLAGLTTLVVCGGEYSFDPESPLAAVSGEMDVLQTDGEYTASNGKVYSRGDVTDLSDLAFFPDLQTLTLSFQSLTSLKTLPSTGLITLKLRCDRLTSLEGVANAPRLEELNVSGNAVADISALKSCIGLKELNLTDTNVSDFSALKGMTKLSAFSASGAARKELRDVLLLNGLTQVRLTDCDLRGDFFDELDSKKLMYLELRDCLIDSTGYVNRLSGLTELHIEGCTGVADWSALSTCPVLQKVYIDQSQRAFFPAETSYELIVGK